MLKANVDFNLFVDLDERRRLQREKRLGPARGKRPPVVKNQQSSLIEPL
ncbi:MAG: hypothetical protein ACE3JN_00385 [Ectobacillus sp.]